MLINAFRNLWKRKEYSLINVVGLSVGIAVAMLLTLYSVNELTHDRFHQYSDDLYMVYKERVTPSGIQEAYDTWVPMKIELEETYTAVVLATREINQSIWVVAEGKRFEESAGSGIFLASGLCALIVALTIVSIHMVKAAKMNPIESLRNE